ncbi:VPS20 [Brettanomyces bruxellensis]|uniref:DEBR0S2_06062g1_1 n=1 Tax=Dekkera bruxellensis TaxID=5007 RepID=A0A7D9CX71_DEKBR|nr:VPS20 [Brettanomyces bruxellensis]
MGNNVSSGRKAPKITSQDKAVLQLKIQRDKLRKTSIKVQTVIKRENEIARQCVRKGDKRRALLALKKRKYQENLLDTVGKQSDSLETLINTIEFKLIEKDVVYGLQEGNKVLKQLNTELSVDKVDKIMDETAEGVSYQEELSERLGELMPRALDAEVDEELERMEREEAEKTEERSKNEAAKLGELPAAPSGELIDGGRKKEKEKREKGEKPQAVPA